VILEVVSKIRFSILIAVVGFTLTISLPAAFADVDLDEAIQKGDELFAKMKVKEAIQQYREAVRMSPDNAKAHHKLGAALASSERRL
jgi:Flp pilus assembly protein TadD